MITAYRIADLAAIISILAWITVYTRLEPWWRSRVGRTLVLLAVLLLAQHIIAGLSLFLDFNRLTSQVAGWVYFALIALVAVTMFHRTWLWTRISREKQHQAD